MVLYTTPSGLKIAHVHQYRRQDGSIGGSGKPDPKRMWVGSLTIATPHCTLQYVERIEEPAAEEEDFSE